MCHGNVIRYCVCRALQLDPQVFYKFTRLILLIPLTSNLPGLAEDGCPQWLYYSACDKAQRQGNENLLTLHRLYFSSYFTTTSQVSLLELGGAGHFDSEMLTFN